MRRFSLPLRAENSNSIFGIDSLTKPVLPANTACFRGFSDVKTCDNYLANKVRLLETCEGSAVPPTRAELPGF